VAYWLAVTAGFLALLLIDFYWIDELLRNGGY
jgi:hypothetical protein